MARRSLAAGTPEGTPLGGPFQTRYRHPGGHPALRLTGPHELTNSWVATSSSDSAASPVAEMAASLNERSTARLSAIRLGTGIFRLSATQRRKLSRAM